MSLGGAAIAERDARIGELEAQIEEASQGAEAETARWREIAGLE